MAMLFCCDRCGKTEDRKARRGNRSSHKSTITRSPAGEEREDDGNGRSSQLCDDCDTAFALFLANFPVVPQATLEHYKAYQKAWPEFQLVEIA